MRRGIMIYDQLEQEWKIWLGQQSYEAVQGMTFEIRIQRRYYEAYLEKDMDWFVTLEEDTSFTLRTYEVYKIRISSIEINAASDVPF